MATKIKFVRKYLYGNYNVHYDVVYKIGMVKGCSKFDMPETVATFIRNSEKRGLVKTQYDNVLKREETVYGVEGEK